MKSKPLVITSKPYEQDLKSSIGTYRKCIILPTNYGPLKVAEAANILGIVPGTLRSRIRRLGWKHPDVVNPGELPKMKPGTKEAKTKAHENESSIYKNLSTTVRTRNLAKLPNPGSWEMTSKE